jgi:hypothetical protein
MGLLAMGAGMAVRAVAIRQEQTVMAGYHQMGTSL